MKKEINEDEQKLTRISENKVHQELERLCKCDKILFKNRNISSTGVLSFDPAEENILLVDDECSLDVEDEYHELTRILDLPGMVSSLTRLGTYISKTINYSIRSGFVHMSMQKFSPLTRGLQVIFM